MKIPSQLVVLLAGEPVGVVRQHATGRLSFVYDDAWREAAHAYPLSLSLPLIEREHEDEAVRTYLEGLLPDRIEVRNSWGRRFGVSGRNAFGLLAHMGEESPGAVQFVRPERLDTLLAAAGDSAEWLSEAEIAERLRNARDVYGRGAPLRGNGYFSIAGTQPKTVLHRAGHLWATPSAAFSSTHVLKPQPGDLSHLAANEHLCLLLAEELGIPAVRTEVLSFEDEVAIVVERFDRVRGVAGAVRRIHQEDLCQALGVMPQLKYEYEGGPGAAECGRLLMEHSANPDVDLGLFVDVLALNWVILGTDAHAKNYGLMYSAGPRPLLTPLYDVISVLPYAKQIVHPKKARLAMRIGGAYRAAEIRRRHWATLARDMGLDEEPLLQRIGELVEAVPDALDRVSGYAVTSGLDEEFTHELLGAIGRRVPGCQTALEG